MNANRKAPVSPAKESAIKLAKVASAALHAAMAPVQEQLTNEELAEVRHLRKRVSAHNAPLLDLEDLLDATAKITALTEVYARRVPALIRRSQQAHTGPERPQGSSDGRPEPPASPPLNTDLGPRDPEQHDIASIRHRLLAPVLSGSMSPDACAAHWRQAFAGEDPPSQMLKASIPEVFRKRYRDIQGRTFRRWLKQIEAGRRKYEEKVERDRAEGIENTDAPPSTLSLLAPHYPETRETHRKVEPAFVISLHKAGTTPSIVADELRIVHGIQISTRRVQQILATHVPDVDWMREHGGPAAEDMMKARLLRELAEHPNHIWQIDSSWLKADVYEDDQEPIDFAFDYARLGPKGERQRASHLHVTEVIDVYSRRSLVTREWDEAPSAMQTLTVLVEAALTFGLPQFLHMDNGPEHANAEVRMALDRASITPIWRIRLEPQGGGKIERFFGTLKSRILPRMPGYRGHPDFQWEDSELLLLSRFGKELRALIDLLYNRQIHSSTGRTPEEMYDSDVGMRTEVDPSRIIALMEREELAGRKDYGIEFKGRLYWDACLGAILPGKTVIVHYDPWDPSYIRVSVPSHNGRIRHLGVVREYDKSKAPPVWEVRAQEAAWRARTDAAPSALPPHVGSMPERLLPSEETGSASPDLPALDTVQQQPEGSHLTDVGKEPSPEESDDAVTLINPFD